MPQGTVRSTAHPRRRGFAGASPPRRESRTGLVSGETGGRVGSRGTTRGAASRGPQNTMGGLLQNPSRPAAEEQEVHLREWDADRVREAPPSRLDLPVPAGGERLRDPADHAVTDEGSDDVAGEERQRRRAP